MSEPQELLEYKTDHDLLIEVRVEMRALVGQLEKLNDTTTKRLDKIEDAGKERDKRISSLETSRAIAYAYAALVTLILIPIVAAYITSGRL